MAILTDNERTALETFLQYGENSYIAPYGVSGWHSSSQPEPPYGHRGYYSHGGWPHVQLRGLLDRDQKCRDQLQARRDACESGARNEGYGMLDA